LQPKLHLMVLGHLMGIL